MRLLLSLAVLLTASSYLASSSPAGQRESSYSRRVPYRQRGYAVRTTTTTTPKPTYKTTTTPQPPPKPFKYAFAAGRSPNGKPDRYVEQEGDGSGAVRGSYAYLDPNWQWRKVEYVADPESGFHVVNSQPSIEEDKAVNGEKSVHPPAAPLDTAEVAKAKARHRELFAKIADRHRQGAAVVNRDTVAVQQKRQEHEQEFDRIAAEHARIAEEHAAIAAEHSRLTSLARQFGEIYDRRRRRK